MNRRIRYRITDEKMLLQIDDAQEGGFVVTSPYNPELITQGDTISEAFANARDAPRALRASHRKVPKISGVVPSRRRG
jgi:antitoxin HicB